MLGLVVLVAITHLAVGYALAIYLGYASAGVALQGSVVTDYASLVADDDIIIADDMEDDDDTEETADESELEIADSAGVPDDSHDKPDDSADGPGEVAVTVPLDDATEALLTSEIDRLFQLLAGFRAQLAHGESPSWGDDRDEAATGFGDIAAFTDAAGSVLDELEASRTSLPEGSTLCQRISAAHEQFNASLSIGLRSVHAVDGEQADSSAAVQQQLLAAHEAAFAYCGVLHDVQLELAQRPGWLDRMEDASLIDRATQLASGPGFVKVLDAQRQTDGLIEQQIVAAFDVDNCRRANSMFGPMWGDQMLVQVGKHIQDALHVNATVGRLSGQRFAVLLPDVMLNAATDEIERVRESIAATQFRRGDVTWNLTVSCALAKPAADESTGDLLKRLDETTLEAKRYGKNRTFLHEDGNPAPVVPPKIEVEPQVIELTEFESP